MKSLWPWWAFFLLLFSALIFPIQDGDIFMYLAIARESLALGRIPALDPFLYTLRDWHILHEWLSYFLWYGAYLAGGFVGVILFKAILWVITFFWAPIQKGLRQSTDPIIFLILFLAVKASSHRFIEKSSLFSDLLSVIVLSVLLQENPAWKKWRWIFPVLFLLAVNLHPGFVVALAWLGIYIFCQRLEKKWPRAEVWQTFIFSLLACLVNPLGVQGLIYPFHTVLKEEWNLYRTMNYEWLPTFSGPFLQTWEVRSLIVLIFLVALMLISKTLKQGRKSIFSWAIFTVLLYLSISANRFIATASLGFCVLGISAESSILQEFFKKLMKKNFKLENVKIKNALIMMIGLFFLAGAISIIGTGYSTAAGPRSFKFGVDEEMMPTQAVQSLKLKMQSSQDLGRIFNEFGWGSYLAWELNTPQSLFIHGHIDDPRFLSESYYSIGHSQEVFDQTMAKYQVRYLFLDIAKLKGPPQPKLLSYLGAWDLIYQDAWAVIYKRKAL